MSKVFNVRPYQEGDEKEIVKLLQNSFPDWNNISDPLAHWKWKFLETPLGTDIVVAVSDKNIVGVSQNILLNLKIGNTINLTEFSCDTTTHQNYRGMGVFGKIVDVVENLRFEKKIKFGYGISSNPAVTREWGKRGRVPFPHPIAYMIRIRDVELHLKMRPIEKAAILGAGYFALKNLNRVNQSIRSETKPKNGFTISRIQSFDDGIDTFWGEIKNHYNFILDKSKNFLNWRYCDPRGGNYIIKQAIRDGKVLGFIALELVNDEKYSEGFIVDLLALPGRLDVVEALLMDTCTYLDGLGVNVIYYLVVKGHPNQRISNRCGFIDSHRAPYVTCHVIDAEKEFEVLKASPSSMVYFAYSDAL